MITKHRAEARLRIIQACNRRKIGRARSSWVQVPPRLFGERQIQKAVCMARRFDLVDAEVLVAAGFRAVKR